MDIQTYCDRLAELIVGKLAQDGKWREKENKPKVLVFQRGGADASPLYCALQLKILAAGGYPILWPAVPGAYQNFLMYGDEQLMEMTAPRWEVQSGCDCIINIVANLPGETKWLQDLSDRNPELGKHALDNLALNSAAYKPFGDIMDARTTAGTFQWMVVPYPALGDADAAGLDQQAYLDLLARALWLDQDDPQAAFAEVDAMSRRFRDWVQECPTFRVTGPKGTDITITLKDTDLFQAHTLEHNGPDGEAFGSGIVSADGTIFCPYTANEGFIVEDLVLTFVNGEVVSAVARTNQAYVDKKLGERGGRLLGEVAFGTNFALTMEDILAHILIAEKILAMHFALGRGYSMAGRDVNQCSFHWDMLFEVVRIEFANGRVVEKIDNRWVCTQEPADFDHVFGGPLSAAGGPIGAQIGGNGVAVRRPGGGVVGATV